MATREKKRVSVQVRVSVCAVLFKVNFWMLHESELPPFPPWWAIPPHRLHHPARDYHFNSTWAASQEGVLFSHWIVIQEQ